MAEPGWDLYRSLLGVLREGSLSGAARRLGLSQPTVGRHLATLEEALHTPLFTRSRDGLRPTDAAERLRPYVEALEATAAALLRAAAGEASGAATVRLTASEVVGAEILPPILASLREAHPELVVELVLSNRVENLLQRDADIAVRMVRPVQAALVVRRIGAVTLGLFARRDYLERHGAPRDVAALAGHATIGFDEGSAFDRGVSIGGRTVSREMFTLRTDSNLAQLAAVRAGYGIGVMQVGIARREPALVRVLPEALSLELGIWLAMHEDLRASRRCRVVFDALATGLAAHVREVRPRSSLGA